MAIFVNLKQYSRFLGAIDFNRPNASSIRIVLNAIVIVVITVSILITSGFLIFERGATLSKYIQCGATLVSLFYVSSVLIIFAFQKELLLGLIDDIEDMIADRERKFSRPKYNEITEKIEDFTIKAIIFMNVLIGFGMTILPTTIVSYYSYYVSGNGEASFMESYPSM